nr:molybdopterin-dependent oxidoreductase [Acetomicrobium mobile]
MSADVFLPSRTWYERTGTYVNTEDRVGQLEQIPQEAPNVPSDEEIITCLNNLLN